MKAVQGRCYLVTGGGSGLGAAVVEALVQRQARAVILDMNADQGTKLASSLNINQHDPVSLFVQTDVTSEESVKAAIQKAKEKFGDIHGVINCAGVGAAMRMASPKGPGSLDVFKMAVNVNLTGTFNVSRLVAQEMLSQKPDGEGERGVIIMVASIAAFEGQIGQSAYSASKGGVVSMTLVMARELGKYGIRVATVAPGSFDTPMLRILGDEHVQKLAKQTPFPQRLGKPEEFGALVLHMIENPMINGNVIRLDGGQRMSAL